MAYLSLDSGRTTLSPAGDKLRLHVAKGRAEARLLPPLQREMDRHLHHVQQMLLAAVLATGAVIAVAAVMMVRLF